MGEKKFILIIDDGEDIYLYCRHYLRDQYSFLHVCNGREGLKQLKRETVGLVLLDRYFLKTKASDLLGDQKDRKNEGLTILQAIRDQYPDLPIIMVTHFGDYSSGKDALLLGADDFIEWGALEIDKFFLKHSIERVMEERVNRDELLVLKYNSLGLIGKSKGLKEVFQKIEEYKDLAESVLIQGESGTGKELVASNLHFNSRRKEHPYVTMDCGALPENLAENELFGHRKGAFTDAKEDKQGLFEKAHLGTIFLDEVGNLSLTIQAKILRVLDRKEVRRVGETNLRKINARVIAATNEDLGKTVREGSFRKDLYWRLNILRIDVPPLRNRREDIPDLIHHFIKRYGREYGKTIHGIAPEAMEYLSKEEFRDNNVRELENLIKNCIASSNDLITLSDLVHVKEKTKDVNLTFLQESKCRWRDRRQCPLLENRSLNDLERDAILYSLERHDWKVYDAARSLGIGKTKLYQKIKEYGLRNKKEKPR